MSIEKKALNTDRGGAARTIKAGYFKYKVQNILFTERSGFLATGIVVEYA